MYEITVHYYVCVMLIQEEILLSVLPGAPLTYFTDGVVRVIFLGLKSWQKGFFGSIHERHRNFFLGCK